MAATTRTQEGNAGVDGRSLARVLIGHLDDVAAVVVALIIVVGSIRRLRYGVDITDEAFYAVITQRFSLGDVPYVDELNLRQTASLLTVPFYWASLKLRGSTDGVIYLLRLVYFGVQCFTGYSLFLLARKRLPRSLSLVIATLPLVFLPFGIPTCSYNSLGSMFFAAGAFHAVRALAFAEGKERTRAFVAAGVCHALCTVAYPPNGIAVVVSALGIGLTPRHIVDGWRDRLRSIGLYALGGAIPSVPLFVILLPAIRSHGFQRALSFEPNRGGDQFRPYLDAVVQLMPGGWEAWLAVLGVFGLYARRYPPVRKYLFGALLLLAAYYFHEAHPQYALNGNSLYLSLYLGLSAAFFVWFLGRGVRASFLLAGVVPSFAAGTISAIYSGNGGCLNAGIGFFAAAGLAFASAAIGARAGQLPTRWRTSAVLVLAAIPLATLAVNLTITYRAGPVSTLTAVVRSGPYAGLRSDPRLVQQVEDLTRDVRALSGASKYLLAYGDVPAAYLPAPVRPPLPTGWWTDGRQQLPQLLPQYQQRRTGEGIVVMRPGGRFPCRELETMVEKPERLLRDYGWAKIYREPPP